MPRETSTARTGPARPTDPPETPTGASAPGSVVRASSIMGALATSHGKLRAHLSVAFEELEQDTLAQSPQSLSARRNQVSRCMRQAENLEQWLQAVMDGAAGFCARAALFAVEGKHLVCRATKGLNRIGEAIPMD